MLQIFNSMNKDWKGDANSVFKALSASNHAEGERADGDFYATDPEAGSMLIEMEEFLGPIWEPSCGAGHLSRALEKRFRVISSDLVDRGYGKHGIDFLSCSRMWDGDIITNPPYKYASEFVEKALSLIPDGRKVAMFLKMQFLEGKGRREFFKKAPPRTVWVSSSRIMCAKNGDFEASKKDGSAVAYCWFVWEKGYAGSPEIKWFN